MIPSSKLAFCPIARLLAPLAASLLAACGNDSSSGTSTPLDPPEIVILQLSPAGGRTVGQLPGPPVADGACVDLATDPDQSLGVAVGPRDAVGRLVNWTLVPPYGCQGAAQCGYLRFSVETDTGETLAVDTATTTGTLPLSSLATPAAPITIRVELLDDTGGLALDAAGDPFSAAQVHVVREPRCGESPPIADSGVIKDSGPVPPTDAPVILPDAPLIVPDGAVRPPDAAPPTDGGPIGVPDSGTGGANNTGGASGTGGATDTGGTNGTGGANNTGGTGG